jgi:hypothetical protein
VGHGVVWGVPAKGEAPLHAGLVPSLDHVRVTEKLKVYVQSIDTLVDKV